MGVDGIGKVPPPSGGGVTPPEAATSPAAEIDHPFSAHIAGAGAASPVQGLPSALEQLKGGSIDLERYLDIKVQEATTTIAGLAPAQVDRLRTALRERLSSDPALVDLVRKATGAVEVPPPRIEE